ncbi:MAG: nucleotidyl transferase AbiEii/AbiGii toxin family protein [Steroidobacteraceae bacterium]
MTEELDVLKIISERLESSRVPFMLTGSFALGFYGKPRMTRDLDFVVSLMEQHVDVLVKAFSADFYIDEDDVRSAVRAQRIFNLMHLASGIKVDLIVRKNSGYGQVEFARRKSVDLAGVSTWITSREDLILSKLVWAQDSNSELQKRDVKTLLDDSLDWDYLRQWAPKLGVDNVLAEISA